MADASGDPDDYQTLAGRGRGAVAVTGSEFIGHATTAESIETAEMFVDSVREAFADATHNVPAYRVRADPFREYSTDDGEPSGSAGKPMLNVLQGQNIQNVVVVVTRYYGGTNLGVGGLVQAYGQATKLAVKDAGIVTEVPHEQVTIIVEYDDSGVVRGLIDSIATTFDAKYEMVVTFDARVPAAEAELLRDRIRSATSGRATIE
jgi:uncharacterized YigZ family protein